jgi:hypothetical protein
MYGFRCQALVSLGPLSTPITAKADRFPVQAVLHPERGVRNFGVLVRIGDDFFVALANLFKRQSGVSHDLSRLDDSKRECTTAAPPLKRASTRVRCFWENPVARLPQTPRQDRHEPAVVSLASLHPSACGA